MNRFLLPFLVLIIFSCSKSPVVVPEAVQINYFKDKTILWTGTSIPFQFSPKSYPQQIAKALEAKLINRSISGSCLVFKAPSGAYKGKPGMAATHAQLIAAGFSHPYSFQSTILENAADVVVIDHGTNDYDVINESLGGIDSQDPGTFYGALNVVIDATLKAYPKAQIILCTPPNAFVYAGTVPSVLPALQQVGQALRDYSKAKNIPLWDMMQQGRITSQNLSKTTDDNIHPNTSTTDSLAVDGIKFFKTIKLI